MIISAHQPNYIPWLGYFDRMDVVDQFIILDNVQFTKSIFINRNKIKTKKGEIMLTVPVKVSLNTLIKDVVIDNDQKWSKKHWLSIKYNYSKAPHWDYLAGELENIYNRDWYKLIDLNMEIIHLINNKLDISTKLVKASDLDEDFGKKTELLVNLCKHMNASIFYPGTGCKKYIDQKEFEKYKIKLIFQQFKYPVYPQRFGDFISNLSIIDLLFNCGPNSLNIIRKGRSMDKALEGN